MIKGIVRKERWDNKNKINFTVWIQQGASDTVSVVVLEAEKVEEVKELLRSIAAYSIVGSINAANKALNILDGKETHCSLGINDPESECRGTNCNSCTGKEGEN